MAKSRLGATCAAVLLSLTFVSAQTASVNDAQRSTDKGRKDYPTRPDTTPSATAQAADARPDAQNATLSGCVVRDAANGGMPTIKSNGISYRLSAKNDQDFNQYLGKKVEVTGALMTGEAARATSGKTSELGIPKDQTAVGGQKDVPVTGAARDNTVDVDAHGVPKDQVPLATDKGTTNDLTGRIDVKKIKSVAGRCV